MTHLSFKDKLVLQDNYGVVLCKSHTKTGQQFFHYVMADKKNIDRLARANENNDFVDFSDFGEIILSGWGEKPSQEHEFIISEYFLTE